MIDVKKGKSLMRELVERYHNDLKRYPHIFKKRVLSEQDITTKFVLPMLVTLNWDALKITKDGAEVHEKGFRERDLEGTAQEKARKGGLPDFSLQREGSKIPFFIEVKHPTLRLNPERHLTKYRDGHIILLTSFKESHLVVVGEERQKQVYPNFVACNPSLYIKEFDNLWQHTSNSEEAEATRRAIKAWRPGQRKNIRRR